MTPTLTDLLMRDPEHPEVRRLLMEHYRHVCAEQALLAKLLRLPPQRRIVGAFSDAAGRLQPLYHDPDTHG